MKYLGHIVSSDRVETNLKKIRAMILAYTTRFEGVEGILGFDKISSEICKKIQKK